MRKLIPFVLFFFPLLTLGQIIPMEEPPFEHGEIVEYDAIYKWGFLDIKAGEVVFSVDTAIYNQNLIYHFKSIGNSLPRYDWIFKVRDTFESIADRNSLNPVYYQRKTSEGGYEVLNKIYFQPENDEIKIEKYNNEAGTSNITFSYQVGLLDLQTAVYYARMLDFSNAAMGEEYVFDVIIDGTIYNIPIRYEGTETIDLNNQSYHCFRLSTQVIEGTIFKSHQTIKIWVESNGSQIPVLVEAPIIVGKVRAELKDRKNN